MHVLSPAEIADVEAAAKALVDRGADLGSLTADDFPIPRLAPPTAQPLPPVFAERFGSTIPGGRGGVGTPRASWNVPLDAE